VLSSKSARRSGEDADGMHRRPGGTGRRNATWATALGAPTRPSATATGTPANAGLPMRRVRGARRGGREQWQRTDDCNAGP
jgi:hypothetical protein